MNYWLIFFSLTTNTFYLFFKTLFDFFLKFCKTMFSYLKFSIVIDNRTTTRDDAMKCYILIIVSKQYKKKKLHDKNEGS